MKVNFPNFWQALVMTLLLVAFYGAFYALSWVILKWLGIDVTAVGIQMIFIVSAFIIIPFIYHTKNKSGISIKKVLALPKSNNSIQLLLLIIAFISIKIVRIPLNDLTILMRNLQAIELFTVSFSMPSVDAPFLISNIHGVIFAPILEELLFRGLFLKKFLEQYSVMKAILLSSLLFALAHFRLNDIIPLFMGGIFYGIVFYKMKSLYYAIAFHAISNLSESFINISTTTYPSNYWTIYILALLSLVGVAFFLMRVKRQGPEPNLTSNDSPPQ
ncbi:CPBP family intramembrane metalloprotease [Puteibacter caeruleilacunae]|nr:CPBP family intramembrane metalloprotease [Puteibacter caeruleilacunae]